MLYSSVLRSIQLLYNKAVQFCAQEYSAIIQLFTTLKFYDVTSLFRAVVMFVVFNTNASYCITRISRSKIF
jgi:hypothetical protein